MSPFDPRSIPEPPINPPDQEPGVYEHNTIRDILEEALAKLAGLQEYLDELKYYDPVGYADYFKSIDQVRSRSRIEALGWLAGDLVAWKEDLLREEG